MELSRSSRLFISSKNFLRDKQMSTLSEREIFEELSKLPDFDCMPIPISWFSKYNIPARSVPNTREFLESEYTVKMQRTEKDLPPLVITEPRRDEAGNIKLVEVAPPEKIDVETITRPYTAGDNVVTLPSLVDDENGVPSVLSKRREDA